MEFCRILVQKIFAFQLAKQNSFFIDGFSKNEKGNLTPVEEMAIRKIAKIHLEHSQVELTHLNASGETKLKKVRNAKLSLESYHRIAYGTNHFQESQGDAEIRTYLSRSVTKEVRKMNWKIKETVKLIRHQISQGKRYPEGSRLDLTSVPKGEEQEWRNAIEKVFKEFNISCPPINFVSTSQQYLMNKKIDDIFKNITDQTKKGKEIEICLDFEGFDQFVTSLPPILINRMRAEHRYAFMKGSSDNILDDDGRQVGIKLKFEPV